MFTRAFSSISAQTLLQGSDGIFEYGLKDLIGTPFRVFGISITVYHSRTNIAIAFLIIAKGFWDFKVGLRHIYFVKQRFLRRTVVLKDFLTKRTNKTVFAFFCLLAGVTLLFSGCGGSREGAVGFGAPFVADAEGTIGGREVSMTVFCDPRRSGEVCNKLTVTFSSPESLKGLTVSLFSDGSFTARLGELEGNTSYLFDAAAPYLVFCPEGDFLSVRVTEEGRSYTYGEGEDRVSYLFCAEGRLKSIEGVFGGEKISLKITNFRKILE